MDKNDAASQLRAAMRENRNVGLFDLYAEPIFARHKPNVRNDFVLHCVGVWKSFPDVGSMKSAEAIDFVQKAAQEYARLKGILLLHYWNNEVVLPITNYIIKKKLGYRTVGAFKDEDPKLYSAILEMVGTFLWEDKPLRGYYEMPASVEYIGNTVFARKIKSKLSEEDLRKFGLIDKEKPWHLRASDEPISDVEVQGYITELLCSRPMDKFNYHEIAAYVRIGEGQASDNLKWLAAHGGKIIVVKPSQRNKRVSFKWCPEAHLAESKPKRKMEYVSKVLYRLLNQNPGTTATGARQLLRTYFGNTDSATADNALHNLRESGLVEMVPDKSHKQRLRCVVQEKTDERRKTLVRLASTAPKR